MHTIHYLCKLTVYALEAYEGLGEQEGLMEEGGGDGTDPPDVRCILVSFDSPSVENIKRVRSRERVSVTRIVTRDLGIMMVMIVNWKSAQSWNSCARGAYWDSLFAR